MYGVLTLEWDINMSFYFNIEYSLHTRVLSS